jgi:putative nucleotidyltransferase with HDIG domain
MQTQPAILKLSEAERPLGERLLKIAVEIDRIEGYSEPHSVMIARLAERMGSLMGLHGTDLTALKYAALLHDIGERVMKRNYLLRPDDLTWEETLDLWRHPILGEQAASELKLARQVQLLIRWHHEWWNGLGYPDGLSGEMIPLGARILRAVDSYYALVSKRPHRRRFDALEAEQIIADLAGIEFDPQVAKKLVALLAKERGLQEVTTPIPTAEVAREPKDTPAVAQPAIVAAEYRQPEPEIREPFPVTAEADPQIVQVVVDAQDDILLVNETETLLVLEPETAVSEERAELSTEPAEILVLEESDTAIWAEPSKAPPDSQTEIGEAGAREPEPLELEKQNNSRQ